jgi:DNA-binding XRE family transcriptional regulator
LIHRGEIVENTVHRQGYTLTKLAEKLGIARTTLYNKFKDPALNYWFIIQIGNALHYNFVYDFPELAEWPYFLSKDEAVDKEYKIAELRKVQDKYTELLERYTQLVELLTGITHANKPYILNPEIKRLIKEALPDTSKV